MPEWHPSLENVKHWLDTGGGWPTLDRLEYDCGFQVTRLTFIFGEVRSPPTGTYNSEPTQKCDIYGYGDSIRTISFDLQYIAGCKDLFYLKQF